MFMSLLSVDFAEFFSKENVMKRLAAAGKKLVKEVAQAAAEELMIALGLPAVCILH
jgi:hypothetical protein